MNSKLTQGNFELIAKFKSMAPWYMKIELLPGVYSIIATNK